MQGLSAEQRKDYVNKKATERKKIHDEIQEQNKTRQVYFAPFRR